MVLVEPNISKAEVTFGLSGPTVAPGPNPAAKAAADPTVGSVLPPGVGGGFA